MLNRRIKVKLFKIKINKHEPSFSFLQLGVFVIIFAVVGFFVLHNTFAATPPIAAIEAENMALPSGATVVNDSAASGGKTVKLSTVNTALTSSFTLPSTGDSLSLRARGTKCGNTWPTVLLSVDGTSAINQQVSGNNWTTYSASKSLSATNHTLSIAYTKGGKNCSLYIDVTNFYGQVSTSQPASVLTFGASSSSVTTGQATTLNWSSANATSCTASGAWSGTKATSGSESTGPINANSTYTLSCTGSGGTSAPQSVTVNVTPAVTRYDLMQNFGGPGGDLSAALAWLASNPRPAFVASGTYNYSNVLDIPAGADIQFQSVTLLPQVIQNEAIRIRGNGTKLDFTGNSRIGYPGRVCGYNGQQSCPRYGNAEAGGLLFEGATNAYVHADNLTIEGMGSTGVFLYRQSSFIQFWGTFTVTGSGEDSYHVTDGSHDISFYAHLNSYSSGDASFAVVSYVGNPGPCYNVYWADVWAASQRWSVGIEVGGGHDITFHYYYLQDTYAAGIYIASEAANPDGYDLMSINHVRFDSGQILRPSRGGIHNTNVEIYNSHPTGYTINDVVINLPWPDNSFPLWRRDGPGPVTNTYVNGQLVQ